MAMLNYQRVYLMVYYHYHSINIPTIYPNDNNMYANLPIKSLAFTGIFIGY